jgi:hypothetical protein
MDCEPLYQKLNVGKNIGFFYIFIATGFHQLIWVFFSCKKETQFIMVFHNEYLLPVQEEFQSATKQLKVKSRQL